MLPIEAASPDFENEISAQTARTLALGELYCAGLPWDALDVDEKAEWHSGCRRYRRLMEERSVIVTAKDHLHQACRA